MSSTVKDYFDLFSKLRAAKAAADSGNKPKVPSDRWMVGHFIALLVGIVAKPFVDAYKSGNIGDFHFSLPLIIFSAIVALAVFPAVFRKALDETDPGIVQLCVTFASGLGYQTLFSAVVG